MIRLPLKPHAEAAQTDDVSDDTDVGARVDQLGALLDMRLEVGAVPRRIKLRALSFSEAERLEALEQPIAGRVARGR